MSESMNQKIQKLLRLAERAGTPEEAETASKMAERLMTKWGIEEAVLRASMGEDAKPEAIVTKYGPLLSHILVKARVAVMSGVVKGMGNMKVWRTTVGKQGMVVIMGYESDVDRALVLAESLLLQADHACAYWAKHDPVALMLKGNQLLYAKRQFLFGFANEVQRRLTEMRTEETAATTDSKSTALVLRDRGKEVDDYFDSHGPQLRTGRSLKGGLTGGEAGREAGRRATLGGTALGGSARGVIG